MEARKRGRDEQAEAMPAAVGRVGAVEPLEDVRQSGRSDPLTPDPYYVEKFLGELLDGPAAEVMRSITERPRIPSDEEMNILVNFVSMQMVRGPKFRERAGRALVENVAAAIGEETKTHEGFNKLVDEKRHALEPLGASIARFGYVEPIILDERTGRIVAGHGRREPSLPLRATGSLTLTMPPEAATFAWWAPIGTERSVFLIR